MACTRSWPAWAPVLALAAALPARANPPQVMTGAGALAGTTEHGVDVFRGIRDAAPPVGANRWRPPQPAEPWTGTRAATRFGHSCWQAVSPRGFGPWTHEYVVAGDISEDCLFLNVWRPARRTGPLPVLVWIHGGGFNSGSGAIPIYDGAALAAKGVVVVTINYRVGVFGFLAHPALTAEAGGAPPANFGLQDIIAALHWVHADIAAFGGDPGRVTIAGQSAGSMAVHELVSAPMAKGLFRGAVGESGLPRPLARLAEGELQGLAFVAEKGARSLAELRAMPAAALQPATGSNAVRFVPVADGRLLPDGPWRPASDVPMLVGTNADEGSALATGYGSADPAALRTVLKASYGDMADRFARLYPAATPAERASANRQVRRDRTLLSIAAWAAWRGRTARSPVYAYRFNHVMPGADAARWGAFHSSEIPYVFRTFAASPERRFTADDRRLSDMMSRYWLNFIRTGDPNGPALPAWPALTASAPRLLAFDNSVRVQPLWSAEKESLSRQYLSTGTPPDAF